MTDIARVERLKSSFRYPCMLYARRSGPHMHATAQYVYDFLSCPGYRKLIEIGGLVTPTHLSPTHGWRPSH